MAKQSNPFFTWKYRNVSTIFVNSDSSNSKSIATSGLDINSVSNDSNLYSLSINCTDIVANYLNLSLTEGTTTYPWITVPILAATTNKPSIVEVLSNQGNLICVDSVGNYFLRIPAGWSILANLVNAVSISYQLSIIASLEDF